MMQKRALNKAEVKAIRPSNLLVKSFAQVEREGFSKVQTSILERGDLILASKSGDLWVEIDSPAYLHRHLRAPEILNLSIYRKKSNE
jgi:hypothetical protein